MFVEGVCVWGGNRRPGLKCKIPLGWLMNLNCDPVCFPSFPARHLPLSPGKDTSCGKGSSRASPPLILPWFFYSPHSPPPTSSLTPIPFVHHVSQCSLTVSQGQVPTPRKRLETPSLPLATLPCSPATRLSLNLYKWGHSAQCGQYWDDSQNARTIHRKWCRLTGDAVMTRASPLISWTVCLINESHFPLTDVHSNFFNDSSFIKRQDPEIRPSEFCSKDSSLKANRWRINGRFKFHLVDVLMLRESKAQRAKPFHPWERVPRNEFCTALLSTLRYFIHWFYCQMKRLWFQVAFRETDGTDPDFITRCLLSGWF